MKMAPTHISSSAAAHLWGRPGHPLALGVAACHLACGPIHGLPLPERLKGQKEALISVPGKAALPGSAYNGQRQGTADAGSAQASSDSRSWGASCSRCTRQRRCRGPVHSSAARLPTKDCCSLPHPCMTYRRRERAIAAGWRLPASIRPHSLRRSLHTGGDTFDPRVHCCWATGASGGSSTGPAPESLKSQTPVTQLQGQRPDSQSSH